METQVKVVENGVQAREAIRELNMQGYNTDHIYVLAHNSGRTNTLAAYTDANNIGMDEEGILQNITNLFKSRGNELRSKMTAIGLSKDEASYYEKQLDEGRVLVIGSAE